jgi:hypothetical protein
VSVITFPTERCRPPGCARGRLGRNGQPIDWSEVAAAEKRLDALLKLGWWLNTQDFFEDYWPRIF